MNDIVHFEWDGIAPYIKLVLQSWPLLSHTASASPLEPPPKGVLTKVPYEPCWHVSEGPVPGPSEIMLEAWRSVWDVGESAYRPIRLHLSRLSLLQLKIRVLSQYYIESAINSVFSPSEKYEDFYHFYILNYIVWCIYKVSTKMLVFSAPQKNHIFSAFLIYTTYSFYIYYSSVKVTQILVFSAAAEKPDLVTFYCSIVYENVIYFYIVNEVKCLNFCWSRNPHFYFI